MLEKLDKIFPGEVTASKMVDVVAAIIIVAYAVQPSEMPEEILYGAVATIFGTGARDAVKKGNGGESGDE